MAESNPAQLSREQVSTLMRSKTHFYKAMQQAGYILPAPKQAIVSIKVLHEVRSGQVYMPRAAEVSACRPVAYPPPNVMLVELVAKAAKRAVETRPERFPAEPVARLVELVKKHGGDKDWLKHLLHCFDPASEVFAKGYRYVRPRSQVQPDRLHVYSNADGFFTGLPLLLPGELKGRQMRLAKKDRQILQMRAYEERLAELQGRMDKLRREMEEPEAEAQVEAEAEAEQA